MSDNPKTCCTSDCAYFNACSIGGIECSRCGGYFCSNEIGEDGLCQRCADETEKEQKMCDELTSEDIACAIKEHNRRLNSLKRITDIHWGVIAIVILANPAIAMLMAALIMWLLGWEAE